ncbi:MAG: hypothetical protein LBG74_03195, partial [Spirochaetaceae bacterium]|nr:hypothetical protein [Spirochaetaceae bacterium]
ENCYSSGNIDVSNNGATAGHMVYAGGLVGWIEYRPDLVVVKNSAALGARAVAATTTIYFQSNRIAAVGNGTVFRTGFGNNFALKNMLIGNDPTAQAQDDAGDAATAAGLGKTLAEFRNGSTWTSELGFDTTIWDVSGVQQGKWPTLR